MGKEFYAKRLANMQWSRFSLTMVKPYVYSEAAEATAVYVQSKNAYLTTIQLGSYYLPTEADLLGPALDVSVCYDLRWKLSAVDTYNFYTIGEPYIAIVDTNNRLYIRVGKNGAPQPIDIGVTHCTLCRGWKHITDNTKDQGIVCLYIKLGRLYSRSYKLNDIGVYGWGSVEEYNVGDSITDVTAARTIDYRMAIVASSPFGNKLLLTAREWVGQAIKTESIITTANSNTTVITTPIAIRKIPKTEIVKTISTTLTLVKAIAERPLAYVKAFNTSGTIIMLDINMLPAKTDLDNNMRAVTITDSEGAVYPITSMSYIYPYIHCTVMDFNNSVGELLVSYTSGWLTGLGNTFPVFSTSFVPTGLVPLPANPPIILSISNTVTEVV